MAARRRRYNQDAPESRLYVDGNTVRHEEHWDETLGESREAVSYRVQKNREKILYMNPFYVAFLALAIAATFFICCQYLMLRSDIAARKHNIQTMRSSISELKIQNDETENEITLHMDLDYIYREATQKLGMVYPSDDQVIYYDKTESEYVRQYEDIPTDD